jgi:hypothetical protein
MERIPNLKLKPGPGELVYDARLDIAREASMTLSERISEFVDKMLESIGDKQIRNLVRTSFENAPEGFYKAPSSTSGKHKPADELDPKDLDLTTDTVYEPYKGGGAVLHCYRAQIFGSYLCELYGIKGRERDEILASLALHDILNGAKVEDLKKLFPKNKRISYTDITGKNRCYITSEMLQDLNKNGNKQLTKNICSYITNHLNNPNRQENAIPTTIGEFIVSLVNYLTNINNIYLEV